MQDAVRERYRQNSRTSEAGNSWPAYLWESYEAGQAWLVVSLVGMSLSHLESCSMWCIYSLCIFWHQWTHGSYRLFDSSSSLGVVIGINAAFIAICTEWLSDIKLGRCSYAWWLNQKFCCWGVESEGNKGLPSACYRYPIYLWMPTWRHFIHRYLSRWLLRRLERVERIRHHRLRFLPLFCCKLRSWFFQVYLDSRHLLARMIC